MRALPCLESFLSALRRQSRRRRLRLPVQMAVAQCLEDRILLAGTVEYRVNAGGSQLSGSPVWAADTQANPSPLHTTGGEVYTNSHAIDLSHESIPAGTPQAIVTKLNAEINRAISRPEVKAAWDKQGAVALIMAPSEFDAYLRKDIEKWAKVVKAAGLAPN